MASLPGSRRSKAMPISGCSSTTSPTHCPSSWETSVPHSCSVDRVADLLPEVPDRDDGRERQRVAVPPRYCLAQQRLGKIIDGVLFYSSSEIYGDPTPENIPTPETYRGHVSCTGPRACYDESKRYGETLCVNFAKQHNLPIKVARPFNNYGPGLKITDGRVIPDFARNILDGHDIVMLSDGSAKRTFCYVADAVVGYYKILVKGRPGEAYNVGVEVPEISVTELASRAVALGKELFGYSGRVVRQESSDKDYMVDNPFRRCPIITKARTELGYDPQVTIDEGLRRSLIWYSGNREASEA